MVIPQWLKSYINSEEVRHLEGVIHDAEKITSAEIRPMVVQKSSLYFSAVVQLRLFGLLVFVIVWQLQGWNLYWDSFEKSLLHVVLGLGLALVGLPLLARVPGALRFFVSKKEMSEQVHRRAQLEFYLNHMDRTETGHGVLIFISILEKQVVVLADKPIAEIYSQDTWSGIVEQVVSGLKKNKLGLGLEAGIKQCSLVLTQKFPIQSNDVNELPNSLIIKE